MAKQKVDVNLKVFLTDFGLTEREIVLYLSLLKTGPNTIMNLSRETGIKRSTTHNNVEELIKKGLVSQTNYGERRMVVAEAPEKLKFLIEQKKWGVKKMEEGLPQVIEMITELVPEGKENSQVEVKYYEGKDGVDSVYKIIADKAKKEIRSFISVESYFEMFPSAHDVFMAALKKNSNLVINEILVESDQSKKLLKNHHERMNYKITPTKTSVVDFDFLIYEDNVVLVQLDKSKPLAVIISSQTLASGLRAFHEVLWNTLPKQP